MIEDTITKTNDIISELVGAVFGRPGQSQDVIPDNMRHGGVDSKRSSSNLQRCLANSLASKTLLSKCSDGAAGSMNTAIP